MEEGNEETVEMGGGGGVWGGGWGGVCFFFQAEDGIRDIGVTGVQTCALPICSFLTVQLKGGSFFCVKFCNNVLRFFLGQED